MNKQIANIEKKIEELENILINAPEEVLDLLSDVKIMLEELKEKG